MATLQPLLILVQPWQDPPNTFRAQNVKDMYSIVAKPSVFDIVYDVGIQSQFNSDAPKFVFRNNTESNDLRLDMTLPGYWNCTSPLPLTILRNSSLIFYLAFYEPVAQEKSLTNVKHYTDEIIFTVTPLLVNGPVYVYNNLPVLTV